MKVSLHEVSFLSSQGFNLFTSGVFEAVHSTNLFVFLQAIIVYVCEKMVLFCIYKPDYRAEPCSLLDGKQNNV